MIADHRRRAARRRGPGRDLEVEVGELGRLGDAADRSRPSSGRGSLAIALSVVRACGMPWLIHGFLPTKNATSQCSNSPRTALPNIGPLTQISPRLLLGDGAASGTRPPKPCAARRRRRRRGGCPARRRRSRGSCRRRSVSRTAPRRSATSRIAVSQSISSNVPSVAAAERVQHPLAATVLVVVEPQRLLARVPLRRRVVLVAPDPLERAPVGAESDLDAAVALAQDARRLLPSAAAVAASIVSVIVWRSPSGSRRWVE